MNRETVVEEITSASDQVIRSAWQKPVLRSLQASEAEHGDSGRPEAVTFS